MSDPLLKTRGKLSDWKAGARVVVSARCGDWGKGNKGTVRCVATGLDPKGRHYVGVQMDGMPGHVGAPHECAGLEFVEAQDGAPELPAFEAGLLSLPA